MITNLPIETYARDRDRLIQRCRIRHREEYRVPAEAVTRAIALEGYKIVWDDELPETMLGCCHFDCRIVLLAKEFRKRVRYPAVTLEVLMSTLAHELGHIRLHARQARQGERQPRWEQEAGCYSLVFLVPQGRLVQLSAWRALLQPGWQPQSRLWGLVSDLARYFCVSKSLMAHALELYGFVHICPRTWRLSPRVRRQAS